MRTIQRLLACLVPVGATLVAGCGDGAAPVPEPAVPAPDRPQVVTLTNFVERTVTITNAVTVTNVVWERREVPRRLSARKTAPYWVSSLSLRGAELRKYIQGTGARILSCDPGAMALVEAPDSVVAALKTGGTLNVHALSAEEKLAPALGAAVRIVPMSFLDCTAVAEEVRCLGGEVLEVVTAGQPAVCAKMSKESARELAARGDVRRIERNEEK